MGLSTKLTNNTPFWENLSFQKFRAEKSWELIQEDLDPSLRLHPAVAGPEIWQSSYKSLSGAADGYPGGAEMDFTGIDTALAFALGPAGSQLQQGKFHQLNDPQHLW